MGIIDLINEYQIPFDIGEVLQCKAAMTGFITGDEQEADEEAIEESSQLC